MDKFYLIGLNLGRVLNTGSVCLQATNFLSIIAKLPNLELKNSVQTTLRFSPVRYRAPRSSFGAMTFNIMTYRITTHSTMAFSITVRKCDTQNNDTLLMLSVMLSVIMLSVIMLSVIMLSFFYAESHLSALC
jgi:hypothetical protein